MNSYEIYNDIVAYCKAHYNEEIVKKYSRYFKEGVFDSWGLTREILTSKIDDLIETIGDDHELIRDTCKILVKGVKYEETSFAINLYRSMSKDFSRETFKDLTIWFETGITNWGHCDVISGDLIFILLSRKLITYNDLKPWLKAKNKYQRRAVPVSLIKLLKTTPDFNKFFEFIEPLMTDPEREVHQGVGWFLREAWKLNNNETEKFLMKWKEISPRLIYQYACEKMTAEVKGRFKRSKV
jgi:3-methyladenine DNA glycosylase AlkD